MIRALQMADRVEAAYAASLAASTFLAPRPKLRAAVARQQAAFVAYLRAYAELYPDEAHLLPDPWKSRAMPEYRAYVDAANAVDRAA